MKQLTDKVFAQVRKALLEATVYIEVEGSIKHSKDHQAAIAALEAAQPVQVNAGYGELEAVMSAEFESHGFGAPESNKREYGRFRVGFASGWHSALTAAQQAQPARPINCGTGHCSCIECTYEQAQPELDVRGLDSISYEEASAWVRQHAPHCVVEALSDLLQMDAKQAQPERAPLSDDEIQTIYLRTYNEGFHGRNLEIAFARAIEAAIKQGGKQAQPERAQGWSEFDKWYWKASESSQPYDWMKAALAAQQVRNTTEQAQPERAPLSEAQVTVLLDSYYASDFGPDELIRKVEQLHGIKQGGQQ